MTPGPSTTEIAELALAAADGEAQATVERERSLLSRFADGRPTQATARDVLELTVTTFRDGHTGSASTSSIDPSAIEECARASGAIADAAARAAPGPGPHPGPAPAAPVRPIGPADGGEPPVDLAGAALRHVFEAGAGLSVGGIWTAGTVDVAIATSAGQRVREVREDAFVKVIATDRAGRTGLGQATARDSSGLDAAAAASRAAAICRARGADHARLDPGEHVAVLAPEAVGLLLEFLGDCGFNGLAHAEERGALCGKLGTRVASSQVNLSDSPRFAATLPAGFDAEGVPKAPVPLIQDGVAHSVVHDRRSGAIAGVASTGHATAPGGSEHGPAPTNLVLIGGGGDDLDDLAARVERGVLITRIWYANLVRPSQALLTGMSRDGTFLIEGGRIAAPLEDVRFTASILDLLASARDLGRGQALVSEGEFYGLRHATGVVCPPMTVGGLRVTS